MKKIVTTSIILFFLTFGFVSSAYAEDSVIMEIKLFPYYTSHQSHILYMEVWGRDTVNNILTPLNFSLLEDRLYPELNIKVPSNGGTWSIVATAFVDYITAGGVHEEGFFTATTTHNATTNPVDSNPNDIDYINGAAMQLSWENAATVSKVDKTQTLRVDMPNMDKYSLTYQTTSGGSGPIAGAITNISLGAGPYSTVTVTAKKGAVEIGKKSIGIFVQ